MGGKKELMESGRTVQRGVTRDRARDRENNFTVLRVLASVFIFAGHMGVIRGGEPPLFGGYQLHELGVGMLFLLSGYLISMSWMSDPHPLRYGIRRFFRLWPPFAVMILVMTFVAGPLLSDLDAAGYFQSWYKVFLKNLRFFIIFSLPGVFTTLPVADTVNGSLWTMPVEAALYVLTPVLLQLLPRKRYPKASFYLTAVGAVAVCGLDLYLRKCCPDTRLIVYGTDLVSALHLTTLYVIGILFTYEEMRKYLNVQAGCIAMFGLLLFQQTEGWVQYLMLYLMFPYIIFSLAFAKNPLFKNCGRRLEPSYGIYLYGFFFQQLLVFWGQREGIAFTYMECLLISAVPTLTTAALSYYLVEKPSLRFGKYLIGRLKSGK